MCIELHVSLPLHRDMDEARIRRRSFWATFSIVIRCGLNPVDQLRWSIESWPKSCWMIKAFFEAIEYAEEIWTFCRSGTTKQSDGQPLALGRTRTNIDTVLGPRACRVDGTAKGHPRRKKSWVSNRREKRSHRRGSSHEALAHIVRLLCKWIERQEGSKGRKGKRKKWQEVRCESLSRQRSIEKSTSDD